MVRRFSVNFALFSISLDAILVCIALAMATQLRPSLGFLPFAAEFPEVIPTPWPIYPVFAFEWIAIMLQFSVYDGKRNLRGLDEFIHVTLASMLAAVALAGTLYLSFREVSRLLFMLFVLQAYLSMLAWRAIVRFRFRPGKDKTRPRRQVLIIGAGPVGRELQKQIQENPQLGLSVVGFLDDNPHKRSDQPDILGSLSNLSTLVQKRHIDDVVIALPQRAYKRTNHLIGELHRLPIKVWVIPDYFRLALHKAAIEEFAGIPMLDLRAPALSDDQRLVKRAFDLCLTSFALLFASPVMVLTALAIRLESPGPVIFRQPRVGENGRIFEMLKFRTMLPQAEELQQLAEKVDEQGRTIHKTANDPRVTRLGRFLRRASLDELPQFFNVLKGDMSLVGPRPELPYLVEKYELWQRQRFVVPQGMTGWWQIHGRSIRPMHLNTEDDLYYVHHYSVWLDVYVLMKTIAVVIMGKGAY